MLRYLTEEISTVLPLNNLKFNVAVLAEKAVFLIKITSKMFSA